jgi:hypothetical protein
MTNILIFGSSNDYQDTLAASLKTELSAKQYNESDVRNLTGNTNAEGFPQVLDVIKSVLSNGTNIVLFTVGGSSVMDTIEQLQGWRGTIDNAIGVWLDVDFGDKEYLKADCDLQLTSGYDLDTIVSHIQSQ